MILTGGVMQCLIGPHGILLKVGPHVKVSVVPAKLDPRFEPWCWHVLPLDVCWQGGKRTVAGKRS